MAFIIFLVEVIIVSLSGVMAPGPITAAAVGSGTKSPNAGALVAVGHGVIEFPLMLFIFFGLGYVLNSWYVKMAIFLLGGLFLLFMGGSMLRSIKHVSHISGRNTEVPLLAGILLSLGNAYFLVWWATVGATLISKAVAFGLVGFFVFGVIHWLCDFTWCYFLSAVSYKGRNILGVKFQRTVFGICGVFLLVFGVLFIRDGLILWSR